MFGDWGDLGLNFVIWLVVFMLGFGFKCSFVGFLKFGDLKEKDMSKLNIVFDVIKML